jgi:hypothetical protein
MTDKARIKIAALVTALFLAGISTAGVALHKHAPVTAGAATPATSVQQAATGPQLSGDDEHEDDGYASQEESD